MTKKFRTFGVKFVAKKLEKQIREERHKWWDEQLGITGHGGDSGGGIKSEYYRNLEKIRLAHSNGLDPYDFDAFLKECGYRSVWTPKMPESSLGKHHFPYSQEPTHGKKTGQKSGNRPERKSGRKTGRSSRRK